MNQNGRGKKKRQERRSFARDEANYTLTVTTITSAEIHHKHLLFHPPMTGRNTLKTWVRFHPLLSFCYRFDRGHSTTTTTTKVCYSRQRLCCLISQYDKLFAEGLLCLFLFQFSALSHVARRTHGICRCGIYR